MTYFETIIDKKFPSDGKFDTYAIFINSIKRSIVLWLKLQKHEITYETAREKLVAERADLMMQPDSVRKDLLMFRNEQELYYLAKKDYVDGIVWLAKQIPKKA